MVDAPRFNVGPENIFTVNVENSLVEFSINSTFTLAHLNELKRHFGGIKISTCPSGDKGKINIEGLSSERRLSLVTDIRFFQMNTSLPIENLCSHLDSYIPTNRSQENLLEWARKILNLDGSISSAGVFAFGNPGVGKTHVCVGLTKEFLKRGEDSIYINASTTPDLLIRSDKIDRGRVFIIDDLNSAYGGDRMLFIEVLNKIHDKGGILFVTSNMSYKKYMETVRETIGHTEFIRLSDRIKGKIKPIRVVGKSQRSRSSWFLH